MRRGQETCLKSHKVSTCQILGSSVSTVETYKECYLIGVVGYNGIKKEARDLKLDRLGLNSCNAIYRCMKCFQFLLCNGGEDSHFTESTGL